MKRTAWVALGWFALVTTTHAAYLDCKKARSKVEYLICDEKNNPTLWSMDFKMNTFYDHLLRGSENKQDVIKVQKKWLKEVRNGCAEASCLKKAYEDRIADLQQTSTLCYSQEVMVFSCEVPQHKKVSLCASRDASPDVGYMQLRMGNSISALEKVIPPQKRLARDSFSYYSYNYPKGGTEAVSIWDGEFRYSLFSTSSAIGYNGSGVILSRGKSPIREKDTGAFLSDRQPPIRVSFTKCIGEPIIFDEYLKYSPVSFYNLSDSLDLFSAHGDISTYGPETDANFGLDLEKESPHAGELEVSPP
jgi:hypothetical protein